MLRAHAGTRTHNQRTLSAASEKHSAHVSVCFHCVGHSEVGSKGSEGSKEGVRESKPPGVSGGERRE